MAQYGSSFGNFNGEPRIVPGSQKIKGKSIKYFLVVSFFESSTIIII